MRKQDRVAAAKQQQGGQESQNQPQPEPRQQEELRGAASDRPARPQREGRKLPLPE
jgi:hypothetical protein